MFIAEDINKNRVHANSYTSGEMFCPECGEELIFRSGLIRVPHFAHKRNNDCWNTGGMSEWHKNWQELFELDNSEIVLDINGERHRADILIGDNVIEFQNSSISFEDVMKRSNFYGQKYKVNWLFRHSDYPDASKDLCDLVIEYNRKIGSLEGHLRQKESRISYRFGGRRNSKIIMKEYEKVMDKLHDNYVKAFNSITKEVRDGLNNDELYTEFDRLHYKWPKIGTRMDGTPYYTYKRFPKYFTWLVENGHELFVQMNASLIIRITGIIGKNTRGTSLEVEIIDDLKQYFDSN